MVISIATLSSTCFYLALAGYLGSLISAFLIEGRLRDLLFRAAFLAHTISLVARGWMIGLFTPNAIIDETFFLPWCLAGLRLLLPRSQNKKHLSRATMALVCLFVLIAACFPQGILPPSPKTGSLFAPLFFLFEVFAHACFLMGALLAACHLKGVAEASRFHGLIVWGFIFYSMAQIVGAAWCYQGWSAPFHWGERHLQSASLWCFYATYVHLNFLAKWDAERRAGFALAGALPVLLFSYGGHLSELAMPRLGG